MSVVTQAGQAEGEDETRWLLPVYFSTPTVGVFELKGKTREKLERLTVSVLLGPGRRGGTWPVRTVVRIPRGASTVHPWLPKMKVVQTRLLSQDDAGVYVFVRASTGRTQDRCMIGRGNASKACIPTEWS